MKIPLDVTLRGMAPSEAVAARVRKSVAVGPVPAEALAAQA